ncbi:MAG: CsiV family protein [Gammaproteobacteria bacterium]
MRFIAKIICLFLLLFNGLPVQAAWYQVEVIVFAYLNPDLDGELWFQNPGLPARDNSIDPVTVPPDFIETTPAEAQATASEPESEGRKLIAYKALPEESYRLNKDYRILKLSANYHRILHVAWQQPGLGRSSARWVHLEKLEEPETETETESELDSALPPELADIQIQENGYTAPEIIFDGTVRLRSTKFLHVDIDCAYFPRDFQQILAAQRHKTDNSNNSDFINPDAGYVRLKESRKIKLNELYYFDHPLFGVLLQVSRLKAGG